MKIGQRLLLGFVIIIVINVIAGLIIVQNVQSVQQYYNEKKDMDSLVGHLKDCRLTESEFRSSYDPAQAVAFQQQYRNITRDIYLLESSGYKLDGTNFSGLRDSANEYHDLVLANIENSDNIENLWRSEQSLISSPGGLRDISRSVKERTIELGMRKNGSGTGGMGYLFDIQEDEKNFLLTHDPSYLGDIHARSNETLAWSGEDPQLAGYLWRYGDNLDVLATLYAKHAGTEAAIDRTVGRMEADLGQLDGQLGAAFEDALKRMIVIVGTLIALSIILSVAISMVATRSIASPIEALAEVSEKVAAGDLRKKVEATGNDEVATLGRSMQKMISSLKERMEFNDALVRNVMDFQVIVSGEGNIIYVNAPAIRLTGYAYGEFSGQDYRRFIQGLPPLESLGSDITGNCTIQRKDLPPFNAPCRISPVKNAEGRRIGTMIMVKDTSPGA